MARRKKGGGRYTPKTTRPRNWDNAQPMDHTRQLSLTSEPTPRSVLGDLIEVLSPVDGLRDATPSLRQLEALLIAADLDAAIDHMPSGQRTAMRANFIDMVAGYAPDGPQTLVDALFLLSLYWADCRSRVDVALVKMQRLPSPGVLDLGTARVIGGHAIFDDRGDFIEMGVEIGYDSGAVVLLSTELAPVSEQLNGAFIADGSIEDAIAMADGLGSTIRHLSSEDAAAHLAYATREPVGAPRPDRTAGGVLDDDAQGEVATYVPLIELVTEGVDGRPLRLWPETDVDELDEVALECVTWAMDHAEGDEWKAVERWAALALFVCHSTGGGWDRWSGSRVASLWRVAVQPTEGSHVPTNREELALFAAAVPQIVRWGHERAGWGDRWLDETLAVTHSLGLELAGVFADEHLVVPADVDERTALIATLAARAARRAFDAEMASIVQMIVVDAAEADPGLMARGKPEIWASGAVYAAAQLNSMFDFGSSLSLFTDDLVDVLDGSKGTIVAKAKLVREALGGPSWEFPDVYEHSLRRDVWASWMSDRQGFARPVTPANGGPVDVAGASLGTVRSPIQSGRSLILRIVMDDIDPTIWREIAVGEDVTLNGLHHIIQVALGWEDRHLHSFLIDGVEYKSDVARDYAEEVSDAPLNGHVALGDVVDVGDTFVYIYDFGDYWQHKIEVTSDANVGADSLRAVLLGGERSGPPEDVGGSWRFADFCEALADSLHPEHEDLTAWAPPNYDPAVFDADAVGSALAQLCLRW